MNKEKRERLEAAGFRVGQAADFLGLTNVERLMVQLRLTLGRVVRQLRTASGQTQKQLATQLRSSQSRVAKIEAAAPDVTLDLSIKAFFAAGGNLKDLARMTQAGKPARPKAEASRRKHAAVPPGGADMGTLADAAR